MRKYICCGSLILIFTAGCSGSALQERADTSAPPATIDLSPAGNKPSRAQKESPANAKSDAKEKQDAAASEASAKK